MLVPCHIALAEVNDVTKFKPLYSLVHDPSEPVSLQSFLSLSGRLNAGHFVSYNEAFYLSPLFFPL